MGLELALRLMMKKKENRSFIILRYIPPVICTWVGRYNNWNSLLALRLLHFGWEMETRRINRINILCAKLGKKFSLKTCFQNPAPETVCVCPVVWMWSTYLCLWNDVNCEQRGHGLAWPASLAFLFSLSISHCQTVLWQSK